MYRKCQIRCVSCSGPYSNECNLDSMGGVGIDIPQRGSELNDGQFTKTWSDDECCRKCQETAGEPECSGMICS